jgi:Domain of unknown function (DUF4263)
VPSLLEKIDLDFAKADQEFAEFKTFLHQHQTFKEKTVVAELKKRLHLSCLLGSLVAGVPKADVYRYEFEVLGAFRADLVVGHSQSRRLVFVEFEGGEKNSLFGRGTTAQMRHWSRQLEHGFGQLVDWAWALSHPNPLITNAFGFEMISSASVVVCGRDAEMDATETSRFNWRTNNIAVGQASAISTCLTYDGLLNFFEGMIAAVKSYNSDT